jgi:hypothetical protein
MKGKSNIPVDVYKPVIAARLAYQSNYNNDNKLVEYDSANTET